MWRRLAIGLTAVAISIGVWGFYRWLERPMPPPLGDLTLEEVTPPGAVLSLRPQKYCDESVPGFWAVGEPRGSVQETLDWYQARFGPVRSEPTARLNHDLAPRSGQFAVYEDLHVFVRTETAGPLLWVMTYDTTSHHCVRRSMERWDAVNVATFIDACEKLIIELWGVEYGAGRAAAPPLDWSTLTFEGGRVIAHSIEDTSIIYAKDGPDTSWHRHERDTACFLD